VLTTTDCNARCYYCYEAGIRRCYMSADVAKDVSDYIIGASDGREVELRWFGGEPLMNPEVIDIICGKLREAGVEYTSAMVSNGYLFNGDVIRKAKGLWNLKSVQITLDGCGEVYNRVKAYKEPGDAYSRVINNVDNALKAGIKVHIHLNVSRKNISDLMTLADELEKTFSKREGLFASAALLGDFRRENERFNGDVYDAQEYLKLRKKLKDAGFEGKRSPLKRELNFNNCMADNDACEIILPDGRLSKCDEQLDKDCFGDIYSKERDTENIKSWKEQVKLSECFGCPLYARCINLKKCAWVNENCSKTSQIIRLGVLKDQITDAYKEWKETLK
ncbi:MAG: radical SAM protein, partial [Clostridia bacterium]|nr:radical SAM protein [Clostridia bacterium]